MASEAAAQSNPIYLQYDGFVRNKDGTLTLSFGYYNTNHVDVKIEPGLDNGFTIGTADRGQPTLFLKGRHRFACSMVLPGGFSEQLQWTVRFAGKTSTTTGKILDPLYELELASEKRASAGLDLATAPKGVCVNRAPSIQVINPLADVNAGADTLAATNFAARVDQDLTLNGSVEDDGLPRGGKLVMAWKKLSGPGEVTFTDDTVAATRARFSAPGVYELELSALDSVQSSSVKVKVTVQPAQAQPAQEKKP
jgi:hypothetical protein